MPNDTTFLFTDIEGSTRLWEEAPGRMQRALAWHDATCRALVERHRGRIVKSTGDGLHAAFDAPADAVAAMVEMQLALRDPAHTEGLELRLRCGAHRGATQARDGDFYGPVVNRAARLAGAAHGGQMLLSRSVAEAVAPTLPAALALRDLGRVRLRDLSEPESVYQVVHPSLRADFPALRSLEATPNNLSQQLNAFIDREDERAEMRALLGPHRLLTLLGVGGIGKSRLSVQLAAEVMDDYPDGVWLVELAPLADPLLVPQAVASVLGVKESAGQGVVDALLAHVRDRRLLIVLDNCEHLLAACADVAKRLLQAGRHLRIVATSREPLRVAGERAYALPALSTPPADEAADAGSASAVGAAALGRHAAVQLLVDRVAGVQPGFRLDDGNAAAVADICRRVDGIPLALELAAARARSLSVQAIATRLIDSFRLLSTHDATVLPRQRTLRALIDWSHDLLSPDERLLFRRLAVFAGGFTLESAEAVCGFDPLVPDDVLDLLTLLAEKSLAAFDASRGRYRLLETVRQYAQEKLLDAGESAVLRRRHRDHLLALAETARPHLDGPEQGQWIARLATEHDNLLAAQAASLVLDDDGAAGLRLMYALRPYWLHRGLLDLGLRLTRQVLAAPQHPQPDLDRCRGLFDAGQLAYFMGRHHEAIADLQACLALARSLSDTSWVASALQPLGMAYLGIGDEATARGHLEEALQLAHALGDPRELAAARNALAQLHRSAGRLDEAQPLYESMVAAARTLGDAEVVAIGLLNLAMVSIERGTPEAAAPMLAEALSIAVEAGSQPVGQAVFDVCAGLAGARGDWAACARFYAIAQARAQRTGLQRDAADEAFVAPWVARAEAVLGHDAAQAERTAAAALGADDEVALARDWLGG